MPLLDPLSGRTARLWDDRKKSDRKHRSPTNRDILQSTHLTAYKDQIKRRLPSLLKDGKRVKLTGPLPEKSAMHLVKWIHAYDETVESAAFEYGQSISPSAHRAGYKPLFEVWVIRKYPHQPEKVERHITESSLKNIYKAYCLECGYTSLRGSIEYVKKHLQEHREKFGHLEVTIK
jgi:hypothetical protein